jgi:hypothetical protein
MSGGLEMSKRYSTGWITLAGTSGSGPEQPEQDWFDCTGYNYGELEIICSQLSGCTVSIMTGEKNSQYFNTVKNVTSLAATVTNVYFNRTLPPGDGNHLSDYMKWVVNGGASWETTFRLTLNLKK